MNIHTVWILTVAVVLVLYWITPFTIILMSLIFNFKSVSCSCKHCFWLWYCFLRPTMDGSILEFVLSMFLFSDYKKPWQSSCPDISWIIPVKMSAVPVAVNWMTVIWTPTRAEAQRQSRNNWINDSRKAISHFFYVTSMKYIWHINLLVMACSEVLQKSTCIFLYTL